jgi:hypothetical protein
MSIIVSVKINDGIVMAADSATTFFKNTGEAGQIYDHANKIVNLVKGLPIGVMTCGAGGIGNSSVDTLLKDLRARMTKGGDIALDPKTYTMESVTKMVRKFFEERAIAGDFKDFMLLRICGYSAKRPHGEVWHVVCFQGKVNEPINVQNEDAFGPRWNGENEALDRLILGLASNIKDALVKEQVVPQEKVDEVAGKLWNHTRENLILPAAPIQDAIELCRFLVETTKGFMRFAINRPKTVGGQVEVATITKHEGFKWVERKHFYHRDLNQEK